MWHFKTLKSVTVAQLLAMSMCLVVQAVHAQGAEPSLDLSDTRPSASMTPVSELTGGSMSEQAVTPPVPAAMPEATTEPVPSSTLPNPPADTQPQEPGLKPPAVEPEAQQTTSTKTKPKFSLSDFHPFQDEKAIKPISYSPLPGIAIFPVLKHGNEIAFGDLPLIFAREYAQRMELKVPETKIYHPIYTVDELRMQGLGHVYDQIMSYYRKAGRPEPMALDYLLKQLTTDGHPISRVIFVEADLDMSHPDNPTSVMERVKGLMTDDTPKQMRYFIHSRLQIFDAEKPDFPMVWGGSWTRSIKTNQFSNVTPSVFADSDSQQAFASVSRQMSREIVYITPKAAYMEPQYDTSVQGKIVEEKAASAKEQPFPNLTETKPSSDHLSSENKQAIQRILQRQNAINP
jgi:hypothetical protein